MEEAQRSEYGKNGRESHSRVEQKRERAIAYTWELCSLRMGNAVRSMNEKFRLPVLPLLYFVAL